MIISVLFYLCAVQCSAAIRCDGVSAMYGGWGKWGGVIHGDANRDQYRPNWGRVRSRSLALALALIPGPCPLFLVPGLPLLGANAPISYCNLYTVYTHSI